MKCKQCGVTIPENQTICSICADDVNHGSDGYYKAYLRYEKQEQDEMKKDQGNDQHKSS